MPATGESHEDVSLDERADEICADLGSGDISSQDPVVDDEAIGGVEEAHHEDAHEDSANEEKVATNLTAPTFGVVKIIDRRGRIDGIVRGSTTGRLCGAPGTSNSSE